MKNRFNACGQIDRRNDVRGFAGSGVMDNGPVVVAQRHSEKAGVAYGDRVYMRYKFALAVTEPKHIPGGSRVIDRVVRIDGNRARKAGGRAHELHAKPGQRRGPGRSGGEKE